MRIDSLSLSLFCPLVARNHTSFNTSAELSQLYRPNQLLWMTQSETTTTFLWSKCIYTHSMHTEAERKCTGNYFLILTQII